MRVCAWLLGGWMGLFMGKALACATHQNLGLTNQTQINLNQAHKFNEFWKQNFYINQNVLIPRPDTETLVEETLKLFNLNSKLNMLDIGTGSGCILLSILKERRNFFGTGIDISKKAINVDNNVIAEQFSIRHCHDQVVTF